LIIFLNCGRIRTNMKIFYTIDDIRLEQSTVLTVGSFDGVHLGHQQIIQQLNELAKESRSLEVLVTFQPHPKEVLSPTGHQTIELLTPLEEKLKLLERSGLPVIAVLPFTREFAKTGYREFVTDILINKLKMKKMVIGHDHAFGRNREGHAEQLKELGKTAHFSVTVIQPFLLGKEIVSSSRIRQLLKNGEVDHANQMLGRKYSIHGRVERGDNRGTRLGFPTANIRPGSANKLIPKKGVYAVEVYLSGQRYDGMMNIGHRPTFNFDPLTLEVHIFNFSGLIYGENIEVSCKKFIREEMKFQNPDELKVQIEKDKIMCLKL
jgi:riboflavin kinase / FMN adenylyltransferase